jgi:dihydrofolate synthase/folylpolyglutamate synthase
VLHDGAHNPAGARALAGALGEVTGSCRPRVLVASVLEDKDAAAMLEALVGHFDELVFTRCSNPRALSPATLESLAARVGAGPARTVAEPAAAVELARSLAGPDGAVVVTGSIYLIADLVRPEGVRRASRL